MNLLWVGAGGAIGSMARYLLESWIQRIGPATFPLGVLVVNCLGSFVIGLLMTLMEARGTLDSTLRVGLTAGVLGGFTTYSGFNQQTLELLRSKAWMVGGLNLMATVGLCLAAGLVGMRTGRWIVGPG
jgi:CrcB protein